MTTNLSTSIYLDHNATTPIDPAVLDAMEPYLRAYFGNPASVEHEHGHVTALAVDSAREQVAAAIGARPSEIIFTGSCTEANNLAVLGVARANPEKRHLITSVIEHPAVLEPARALEREGWRVTYVGVNEFGVVSPEDVKSAIQDDTALVSIMAANNEVGSIQPVAEIGAICAERGVLFHTDLAQVVAHRRVNVDKENIHLASLSAHKAYGPKGIGALYVRSRRPRVKLAPLFFGGGQERGLRPGTLNTASIVGMGEALSIAFRDCGKEQERLHHLCSKIRNGVLSACSRAVLNGDPDNRLPNNVSFSIEGVDPLALIRRLRDRVSFSASSACATDKMQTSHVLLAMFGDGWRARNAFRVAPGRFTTDRECDEALHLLVAEICRLSESRSAA